ncbi:uncharacterized protein LACBIDRAFT_321157 [Laccaria bicolor S238N-H82]|uniref:Predicted protein n=1 Tax=Laccaria bicolor (strain S238N-H82 / ATCC MYA-4686) TaxID=486041 RepID=B0CNY2_LACBS|nr:uncharacterized protein LACBIDRAFT_321157 [Laccaria bicolor S238N-H82]EDR15375.1 predicted protein [Laccaria bicolor S238N-H82]|eukprot:XP_001873583.1 predicted protein [Laccaria bicolor S238N-H82]
MLLYGCFVSALLCAFVVAAAPPPELVKRQAITPLTATQISAFKPFTIFASTAYCNPSNTLAWNCGANCKANADFLPVASGGRTDKSRHTHTEMKYDTRDEERHTCPMFNTLMANVGHLFRNILSNEYIYTKNSVVKSKSASPCSRKI